MQSPGRRKFLIQSGAILSASLLTIPSFSSAMKPRLKMGLQLYSIKDAMEADVAGTLKKVAAMGYQDLETYGFDEKHIQYYGMGADEFVYLLQENKLVTTSGHYNFFLYLRKSEDDLKRYVDRCIEGAHRLKQRYITWPWLDPESRSLETFKMLPQKLNLVGELITKAGLGFAYHNHDFEFTDYNGENGYDIIIRETDPSLVKLQIDLYWAVHASKLTPAELFAKQPGRFVMWHIKDMDKITRDYTELGNGSIDYTKILPEAKKAGLQYYYIEQGGNFATSSMKSAADSALFFKENLERFLK